MPDTEEHEPQDQAPSARPFWSGTITFGLVSIPVNLFPAHRSSKVSFRMLGPNGKPLARRYYSSKSGRELDDEDIIRGYEITKNKHIEISDEELDRLAPERSRDINLKRFVDIKSIPRVYFEHTYFLAPESSAKAYLLLAQTMERTERAGIATFVMRGKEYLVAITAENGILSADTLRFKDEIRSSADVGLPQKQKPGPTQVRSFERLIGRRSRKTLPAGALRDQASERLLKIIKRKQASRENVVEAHGDEKPEAPVIDLFEALRQSMGKLKRSSPRSARRGKSGGNATRRKAAGVLA